MKNELLADALRKLKDHQDQNESLVIPSSALSPNEKKILSQEGYLADITRDWKLIVRPSRPGDTTPWMSSFWSFSAQYLNERFGDRWSLSPVHSLLFFVEANDVPIQLLVYAEKANNSKLDLPFNTSFFFRPIVTPYERCVIKNNIRMFSLEDTLLNLSLADIKNNEVASAIALRKASVDKIMESALALPRSAAAVGRLIGAYQHFGMPNEAKILEDFSLRQSLASRPINPFSPEVTDLPIDKSEPAFCSRLRVMWQKMRSEVEACAPPIHMLDRTQLVQQIQDAYEQDAYHSLSIEGYRVSEELIQRVRDGSWDPASDQDKDNINALAARGYYQAFERVKQDILTVVDGKQTTTDMLVSGYRSWKEELFMPNVNAGLMDQSRSFGFRKTSVFISKSRHTPPSYDLVLDAMGVFEDLVKNEPNPFVTAVLGHFFLGYIHPFFDGNGRTARLFMNAALVSNGYPWCTIKHDRRSEYMEVLEKASVDGDISGFAQFIASHIQSLDRGPPKTLKIK